MSLRDRFIALDGGRATRRGIGITAAIVLFVAVMLAVQMDSFSPGVRDARPIDHHKYIYMAEHPWSLRTAPFCYRLLVPTIVMILGVPTQIGFWAVATAAMLIACIAVYASARRLGACDTAAVAAGICLLAVGPISRVAFAYYPSVDPVAWCLIATGILAILDKRDGWLAVIMLIGAIVKEPVFFLIALHYGWSARRIIDPTAAIRSVILTLGGLALYFGIRLVMPPMNNDPEYLDAFGEMLTQVQLDTSRYDIGWLLEHVGRPRLRQAATPKFWYDMTVSAFGPMILVLAGLVIVRRDVRGLVIRAIPFVVLCFLPVFVARATVRMIVVAAPLFVIAAAVGLSGIAQQLRIRSIYLMLLPAIQLAAIVFLPPPDERVLSLKQTAAVIAAMVVYLAVVLIGRCRLKTGDDRLPRDETIAA